MQAEFGVARGDASLPYTLTMIGFGIGGILMGRLSDRFGVIVPLLIGGAGLGLGFVAAGTADSLLEFTLAHGVLIGLLGCSATFAPLVADTSLWFNRRRGIAVAICASGNYLAGAVWPPVLQHFFDTFGWRDDLRRRGHLLRRDHARPGVRPAAAAACPAGRSFRASRLEMKSDRPLGLSPNALMVLLAVAGVACCVAMSMPQVHIVAYCGDLGYGAARGAEMLSLMLGFGIVSRLVSGWISDRIGGLRTLLLGSALQGDRAAALPALRRPGLALRRLGALRPVPGRHRARPTRIIVREYFPPARSRRRAPASC